MKYHKSLLFLLFSAALLSCGKGGHEGHAHGADEEQEAHAEAHGHQHEAGHGDEIALSPESAKRFGVTVEKVSRGEFAEALKVSGQIEPAPMDQSVISAPTSGILRLTQGLSVGSRVSAGARVGSIDSRGVAGGDPNAGARTAVESARRELDRITPLYKEGLASAKEYNDARAAYETALAGYSPRAASGAVTAASSGVITRLQARSGQYVAVGEPIAVVSGNSSLTLRADLPARHAAFLPMVRSANFRPEHIAEAVNTGDLGGRLLSGSTSPAGAGYIPVFFSFNNNGSMVPGSYAEVWLLGPVRGDVISVPVEALTEQQGAFYVYTRVHDDAYLKHRVQTGGSDGRRVEILSGLKEGDMLVTGGASVVKMAENSGNIPEGHSHNH